MGLKELHVPGTNNLFFHSTKRDRVVFVEEIAPELICPVCDDVFDYPWISPCGHAVCQGCIKPTAGRTGSCFTCAELADPDDFTIDLVLGIRVGDTRCFCRNAIGIRVLGDASNNVKTADVQKPNMPFEVFVRRDDFHETACSRSVPLRELNNHEAECEFQTLICDLCDEEVDEEIVGGGVGNKETLGEKTNLLEQNVDVENVKTKKAPPEHCGFACLRRDMPSHQVECGHREVPCPFAMKGQGKQCRWKGAARRARTKHAEVCVAAPRPCPNKCGLRVSTHDLAQHKQTVCTMQDITCAAPDAEAGQSGPDGKHKQWCDSRCQNVIKRKDLGKHRRETCEFARAARCRLCRELVSLRSASGHAMERCSRARRLCPNECGVSLPLGDEALKKHVDDVCQNAPAECPYKSLGCVTMKRLTRKTREEHLRHATGAHAELLRVGLVDAKKRSDAFRVEVDSHRETLTKDAEKTREEATAYLDGRLEDAVRKAELQKAEDESKREQLQSEVTVLGLAMSDLSTTTSGRMLELFDEIRALRHELESFKKQSESQIAVLRQAVDTQADKASSLFEKVGATRDDAIGKHHLLVTRALEEERNVWRADIDTQARALRENLEAYKLGVNAKMRYAWDALRAAGRKFV